MIADKIKVKVTFPLSSSSLTNTIRKVKNIAKLGYIDTGIDTGAWVYVKNNPDGTITIYEYPRTLLAIDRYLPTNYNHSEKVLDIF